MQKVLIIGLGGQGQKYIDYFLKNNYEVYGVCKTHQTKQDIEHRYKIKISLNYEDFLDIDFRYIIIALPPDIQGQFGMTVAQRFKSSKIIIELPVSFDMDCIMALMDYDNVSFFIEEYFTLFAGFLRKIDINDISEVSIKLFVSKKDLNNKQALQVSHIHLLDNFYGLDMDLSKLHIVIETHEIEDIFYEIYCKYKGKNVTYSFNKEKGFQIEDEYVKDNYNFDFVVSKILQTQINKDFYLKILNFNV